MNQHRECAIDASHLALSGNYLQSIQPKIKPLKEAGEKANFHRCRFRFRQERALLVALLHLELLCLGTLFGGRGFRSRGLRLRKPNLPLRPPSAAGRNSQEVSLNFDEACATCNVSLNFRYVALHFLAGAYSLYPELRPENCLEIPAAPSPSTRRLCRRPTMCSPASSAACARTSVLNTNTSPSRVPNDKNPRAAWMRGRSLPGGAQF